MREVIYKQIEDERLLQNERWGGADNDDCNTPSDWGAFIAKHSSRAVGERGQDRRYALVRVAALAVAAIEAFDRGHG